MLDIGNPTALEQAPCLNKQFYLLHNVLNTAMFSKHMYKPNFAAKSCLSEKPHSTILSFESGTSIFFAFFIFLTHRWNRVNNKIFSRSVISTLYRSRSRDNAKLFKPSQSRVIDLSNESRTNALWPRALPQHVQLISYTRTDTNHDGITICCIWTLPWLCTYLLH